VTSCHQRRWVPKAAAGVVLLTVAVLSASSQEPAAPVDFSVLHISDIHIDPHLARSGPPGPPRGADTIRWICEQAGNPQPLPDFDPPAPPPAFAIATGDLTEYGVIDDTWDVFERAWRDLPCPLYVLPGNHDNTWVAMYHILRQRHGGANYSFDRFGCHFVCLSSASPQEPVPSLDATTRSWLKADLERTPAGTPIFIALHHPPYVDELANPAELETLLDLLRDHNVVLLLYGHGHQASYHDIGGIPGVMGGSTYGKTAGYGLLSVRNGRLRYVYRFHQPDPQAKSEAGGLPTWKTLYEGPLPTRVRPRLFDIEAPAADAVVAGSTATFAVRLREGVQEDAPANATFKIDGQKVADVTVRAPLASTELSLEDVVPGAHLLTVTVQLADGRQDLRTRVFHVQRPETEVLWRMHLPAAVKAGPVVAGDLLVVARTDGRVVGLDKQKGSERWTFAAGGEVLATPALAGELLVFGSGDGGVYALDRQGSLRWKREAGVPVYGAPAIADDTVYIGDNGGRLHALALADGQPRWVFDRADYSIECRPAVWGDLIVFGAWDGQMYAVTRSDGQLRWKTPGPKSSTMNGNRYYAPADCGPVVIDDTLFVCDRGYELGAYSPAGQLLARWTPKAAAIFKATDPAGLYVRTTEELVLRLDSGAKTIWQAAIPAGRFPIPPAVCGDVVYVCGNRGRLSALRAADGAVLWTFQVTPGFFVMAPPAVDPADPGGLAVCYVAGMDGTLVAVRGRPR
jgi:outer membrane protein assembly factor BamB